MTNKRCALFIMSPILSHVIPSCAIADWLKDTHTIVYSSESERVTNFLANKNFYIEELYTGRFGVGSDPLYCHSKVSSEISYISFLTAAKYYLTNSMFRARKRALEEMIFKWKPSIIFIDVFSSTDYIILHSFFRKEKIVFISPMLIKHSISEKCIINNKIPQKFSFSKKSKLNYILNFLTGNNPVLMLKYNYLKSLLWINNSMYSSDNIMKFKNVPELVLAPEELEEKSFNKDVWQYYLGLNLRAPKSNLNNQSDLFKEAINTSKIKKSQGQKIIYCSFGTYFSTAEEFKSITAFLFALLTAIEKISSVTLIISVNGKIEEILRKNIQISHNVYIFSFVDQINVLSIADAFITHGGLGSIKEAIQYEVPMLVYPVDLNWDQPGNALKVVNSELGLNGDLRTEEPIEIFDKLNDILFINENKYKTALCKLHQNISEKYNEDFLRKVFNSFNYKL